MTLKELNQEIKEICKGCIKCDPCCTGNILIKCIENNRMALSNDNHIGSTK